MRGFFGGAVLRKHFLDFCRGLLDGNNGKGHIVDVVVMPDDARAPPKALFRRVEIVGAGRGASFLGGASAEGGIGWNP